jgi:hypothetical protein
MFRSQTASHRGPGIHLPDAPGMPVTPVSFFTAMAASSEKIPQLPDEAFTRESF